MARGQESGITTIVLPLALMVCAAAVAGVTIMLTLVPWQNVGTLESMAVIYVIMCTIFFSVFIRGVPDSK